PALPGRAAQRVGAGDHRRRRAEGLVEVLTSGVSLPSTRRNSMTNGRPVVLSCFVSLVALAPARPASAEADPSVSTGVVGEQVASPSAAEKAGLLSGDVLVSWSRPPAPPANPQAAQGRIDSPLDVSIVELEQLPRGPVIVAGHRGSSDRTWTLTPVLSLGVT